MDEFVDALASRIASFDKWAIANVNDASLPSDVEIRAGWDACTASVKRPAAQESMKALLEPEAAMTRGGAITATSCAQQMRFLPARETQV
jgi:hypothetical protein